MGCAMNRLAVVLALLIGLAVPACTEFQDGFAAYNRHDYATALQELKPLAEQGDSDAQFILGQMYYSGMGVPPHLAEAVTWYRKAAEQGHGLAQFKLGLMYDVGEGVPKDIVLAHMWLDLAASRLPPGMLRGIAVLGREKVAAKMTPAQIAEAQRLAREWKPKKK